MIGSSPKIVQSFVKTIGSSRLEPASATDSKKVIPCFLFKLILSITNIELVTMIPNSASTPICVLTSLVSSTGFSNGRNSSVSNVSKVRVSKS